MCDTAVTNTAAWGWTAEHLQNVWIHIYIINKYNNTLSTLIGFPEVIGNFTTSEQKLQNGYEMDPRVVFSTAVTRWRENLNESH